MTSRRVLRLIFAAVAVPGLAYGTFAGLTWLRYGRTRPGEQAADELLDRVLPNAEVDERHEIRVAAPPKVTLDVARALDLQKSPLVGVIFNLRTLPSRLRGQPVRASSSPGLLAETEALGWGLLAEDPDREIVMGAVTQPWKPVVKFQALPPAEFAAFQTPGYAKVAWTLAAEPLNDGGAVFQTRTRVATTDPEARRLFRRYWSLLSAGILVIRYEALRLVKAEAERKNQGGVHGVD